MISQGTHTVDGFIPHSEVAYDGGILFAPVKLAIKASGNGLRIFETGGERLPVALKLGDSFVFALPAGRELIR